MHLATWADAREHSLGHRGVQDIDELPGMTSMTAMAPGVRRHSDSLVVRKGGTGGSYDDEEVSSGKPVLSLGKPVFIRGDPGR